MNIGNAGTYVKWNEKKARETEKKQIQAWDPLCELSGTTHVSDLEVGWTLIFGYLERLCQKRSKCFTA